MIVSQQHFDLGEKRIMEKLIIKPPFRFSLITIAQKLHFIRYIGKEK